MAEGTTPLAEVHTCYTFLGGGTLPLAEVHPSQGHLRSLLTSTSENGGGTLPLAEVQPHWQRERPWMGAQHLCTLWQKPAKAPE